MVVIGYSGHAFVVCGILHAAGKNVTHYCDNDRKSFNPFDLEYLGQEDSQAAVNVMKQHGFFVGIGDNAIRKKVAARLADHCSPVNAIHPSAVIDKKAVIAESGVMIAAGVKINPLAKIATGAICNTGCIIEHECVVEEYAHIGPGAILCGNVSVNEGAFIGAGAIIRQNITIGKNAVVGAGAVVIKNVDDNEIVAGNPAKKIIKIEK